MISQFLPLLRKSDKTLGINELMEFRLQKDLGIQKRYLNVNQLDIQIRIIGNSNPVVCIEFVGRQCTSPLYFETDQIGWTNLII